MRSTCLPSRASRLRVSIPLEGGGGGGNRPAATDPDSHRAASCTLEGANLPRRGVSDGVLRIHSLRNSRVLTYVPRIRHIGRVYLRFARRRTYIPLRSVRRRVNKPEHSAPIKSPGSARWPDRDCREKEFQKNSDTRIVERGESGSFFSVSDA